MRIFKLIALLLLGVTLTMNVAAQKSVEPNCITYPATSHWTWGLGGGSAWMQYTQPDQKPIFTVERSVVRESVQLMLHDASAALVNAKEIPGYVRFSFESGYQSKRDKDIRGLDGYTISQPLVSGTTAIRVGNLNFASAKGLAQERMVNRGIKGSFRFYVEDTCYEIAIDKKSHTVLTMLFAPHEQFSREARKLFIK